MDVNPTAVWLCELRLWLSVVIESDERRMSAVPPLPNLDCNVRVGDALAGDAFSSPPSLVGPPAALAAVRLRYARATGARKATLRRTLDREERRRAIAAIDRRLAALRAERRERVIAMRSVDLFGSRGGVATLKRGDSLALRRRAGALRRERERIAAGGALPFAFATHFGHVHARGGFGLVVGNPPWVRLHNIPAATRASLRERYAVFRDAAWAAGAERAGAGPGFGAQVDLAALFVERSLALTAAGGVVALLVPAKLWRSLAGGGTRALLARDARLLRLEDWSEAPCAFDAAVYPSIDHGCALRAAADGRAARGRCGAVRSRSRGARSRRRSGSTRAIRRVPGCCVPPEVRAAFDRIAAHGRPLGDCGLGRPTLGVKCGCNEAFAVEVTGRSGDDVIVTQDERSGPIERAMVRPLASRRGDRAVAAAADLERHRVDARRAWHAAGRASPRTRRAGSRRGARGSRHAAIFAARAHGGRCSAPKRPTANERAWCGATSGGLRARPCCRRAIPRCRSTAATSSRAGIPTTRWRSRRS